MFQKVVAAFKFLRIMESNSNRVSMSNVAVWIVLVKLGFSGSNSLVDVGALLITLLSYQSKKIINHKVAVKETSELENQLNEMKTKLEQQESKVSALVLSSGLKGNR